MQMDNLVKRLERNSGWRNERWQCVTDPALLTEAAARITALETALAEAEGRVETARNEAFEEAAKACEAVLGGALEALSRAQDGSIAAVAVRGNVTAARYCAQAIRDMKDRDSPSPPPVVENRND